MKKITVGLVCVFALTVCGCKEEKASVVTPTDMTAIKLDKQVATTGTDIMQALTLRKSTRDYDVKPLSHQDLSTILWAADGVNRTDGKRTAGTAMNKQYIRLYAIISNGVYLYDADLYELKPVKKGDFRGKVSSMGFVADAPLVIVFVTDLNATPGNSREEKLAYANATAGLMGQNVYLMCAALKAGTVFAAWINTGGLKEACALPENLIPLYIMPVGYLK